MPNIISAKTRRRLIGEVVHSILLDDAPVLVGKMSKTGVGKMIRIQRKIAKRDSKKGISLLVGLGRGYSGDIRDAPPLNLWLYKMEVFEEKLTDDYSEYLCVEPAPTTRCKVYEIALVTRQRGNPHLAGCPASNG